MRAFRAKIETVDYRGPLESRPYEAASSADLGGRLHIKNTAQCNRALWLADFGGRGDIEPAERARP